MISGTVVPVHSIKTYRGKTGIAPLVSKLDTRWRWMVNIVGPRASLDFLKERKITFTYRDSNPGQHGL
jgi:hypothetical protein